MSDEEKKAIEYLKRHIIPCYGRKGTIEFMLNDIVLNLIEKQSKEIEELKTQIDEHVYYDLGGRSCGKTELLRHYKKGYDMNNKFWKDKIKAKIEEYKKQQKEEPDSYLCIKVLQSLLEKGIK